MKAKKLFPVIIAAFLLTVTALSGFAGCAQDDEEPTYDVAIKIANNYGMEWVFEPGVDELYYEFEYTGEDMTFGVDDYYVYGAPHGGDRWLDCSGSAINYFWSSYLYKSPEEEYDDRRVIKERGEYSIVYGINNSSWNYRSVILYITVK